MYEAPATKQFVWQPDSYFRLRPVPDCNWRCKHTRCRLRSLLCMNPRQQNSSYGNQTLYFRPRPVPDCNWRCKHTRWRFRSLLCMNPRPHNSSYDNQTLYFRPRPVPDCNWRCKHTRWRFRSLLCMNPRQQNSSYGTHKVAVEVTPTYEPPTTQQFKWWPDLLPSPACAGLGL